jgi:tetratricopeptide (TPR) repeat protein
MGFVLILLLAASACTKTIKEEVIMPPHDLSVAIKTITIRPFIGSPYGVQFAEHLSNRLVHEGFITVMKTGSEAFLGGTLSVGNIHTQSYSNSYPVTYKQNNQNYTTTQYVYTIKKSFEAGVTYSVDSQGRVIGGNSYSTTYEQSWNGSSLAEAQANAQSDESIIGTSLDVLVRNIIEGISPHKEFWSFKLQDAGNDYLKAGISYYEKGLYSQAEEYYKKVISQSQKSDELAAAYYDIGVLRMRQGNYQEAFDMFKEADKRSPANSVYMDALANVEKAGAGQRSIQNMRSLSPDVSINRSVSKGNKNTRNKKN